MIQPVRNALLFALSATGTCIATCADAQNFPVKPVRAVVGFAAGSSTDVAMRLISPRLGELWGQQVIVDNRACYIVSDHHRSPEIVLIDEFDEGRHFIGRQRTCPLIEVRTVMRDARRAEIGKYSGEGFIRQTFRP